MKRQAGGAGRQVPQREIERRLRIFMPLQIHVRGPDHPLGAERQPVAREDHRREFGQRRSHTIGIGRQVMRDRADLAPAGQPGIAFQPQNAAGDGVANLPVRHVVGDVACQWQMPQGQAGDVHDGWPSMQCLPAR